MNNSAHPHHRIAKDTAVIGMATFASRVLGFLRDMVIARVFGIFSLAQAFVIAFRIPNLFRDFIGEGASNAALVPVLSVYEAKRSRKEFWELVNVVLSLLLAAATLITVLGIIFSPMIVRLIAPGFSADPDKFAATVTLNRIIFPYLILIVLFAFAMGVLNSLKDFAVSAFAPCLLNISIIIFALIFGEGIKGLALGVLVGGVLQLAVQLPVLFKYGFRPRVPEKFNHPEAIAIGKLMLPRVLSTAIYQLNNFVDSIFGSLSLIVGEGGVAVLYFAYRMILFPLGIFSTSFSQALLPHFSTQALEDGGESFKRTLSWGLRATFLVMLPASALFMGLSVPIISVIFQRGRFDAFAAAATSQALFFYSIGLSAYGANKIVQSCFFALKDTATPAKIAALALALNIILNTLLMFPLQVGGIALATSVSGIVSFAVLLRILFKRLGDFGCREIGVSFLKIIAASALTGISAFLASALFSNKYLSLAVGLVAGGISYLVLCILFRVHELRELWEWICKRR